MSILSRINNQWMGSCTTHINKDREKHTPNLYLTFDDGPDPLVTQKVLRILEKYKVCATFFVIVKNAVSHPSLIFEMKSASHAVGNHSWDHRYLNYFRGSNGIKDWVKKGEEALNAILQEENIGFRPPAGIHTPPLHGALKDLGVPLILWNRRFFDTQIQWTTARALFVMDKLNPGDIILLHDRVTRWPVSSFLDTLSVFIEKAHEKGFCFKPLAKELYRQEKEIGAIKK
jgi:peptidoglycan/xylan/chitin deacetylase (PgdA/CDA1 family)